MRKPILLASFFVILCLSRPGLALDLYPDFGPLETRTQNPLTLLFLSPVPENASVLDRGHSRFSVAFTLSNLIERSEPGGAKVGVDLDMEIYRTSLRFAYGVLPDLEAGLEVPFLSFSGGFLDAFLQGYHNTFGFPNEGRDFVPNGRFSYLLTENGRTLYSPSQSAFGLSDLSVYLKYRFLKEGKRRPAFSVRTALKFPTGDRGKGLGSGETDFALQLALEKSYKRFHSYSHAGFLGLGGFEPLERYLNAQIFTFGQAFEINMTSIASVVAQIQGATPFFGGTGNPALEKIPLDLNIGFKGTGPRGGPWEHFEWAFAFGEDLVPEGPSVDFSLHFQLGAKF